VDLPALGGELRMWSKQSNENGEPLTRFERRALIERHCELFSVCLKTSPEAGRLGIVSVRPFAEAS